MSDLFVYTGLFVAALTAATLLPTSSEAVLAALLVQGKQPAAWLLAVATIGNTLGSVINWMLGRWLMRYRMRRWFPITPAGYERAVARFSRWGTWGLLGAWMPLVGDPLTLVAGALRVPFMRFVLLVGLGKAARYAAVWGATYGWGA